ncbi:MAG: hypothetical protein NFCOHLIN_02184 [Gammaproteobacteria bacterium]|nr:hypothetical protein [Gammaproteobacteria bacterium]
MISNENPEARRSLVSLFGSIAAAAMGVQSTKNRERDFTSGSPMRFVVAGLIGTILFVLTMFLVVKLVLRSAGH